MMSLSLMLMVSSISAPIIYWMGRRSDKVASSILAITLMIDLALVLSTLPTVLLEGVYLESYYWIPMLGSVFTLFVDGVSLSMTVVTLILCLAVTVFSVIYLEGGENSSYYAFLSLLVVGLVGVFITSCLLAFYFFWELMLIPSYFIIAQWGYHDAQRVAFKFFIFTHVGAVFVLLGIGSVFMLTNTLDIFQARAVLATASSDIAQWVPVIFTAGFMVKMAIVPLHMWLPDAHSESPAPLSALLSGVLIEAGGYAIFRISLQTMFPIIAETSFGTNLLHSLTVLGLISAYYGAFNALTHNDIKRVIAYSSISQMGYTLFGLSVLPLSPMAGSGAILHLVNHAVSKGLFFLTAGSIMKSTGLRDIGRLGGLARKMPLTALSSSIAAFSIAGVPGFACFMSEFLMLLGCFQSTGLDPFNLIPTVLMVVVSILCAAYALRLFWKVFLGKTGLEKVRESHPLMTAPMMFLSALVILLGVWPRLFLDLIMQTIP